jgi:Kef-type K+ transport system membrane component KefB
MNIPIPLTDPVYIFCVMLLCLSLAPWISEKTKVPTLVILIMMGACLSPNLLGILERNPAVQLLEKIGLLSIMLLAGVQMNLTDLNKVGIRALVFGFLTFSVPFSTGFLLGYYLQYPLLTCLLLGTLFSSHVLISYPIVMRWGVVAREAVSVAIGGTVVTSILTLSGLAIVQSLAKGQVNSGLWLKLGIGLPILIMTSFWIVDQLGKRILTSEFQFPAGQFMFILSTLFIIASLTLLMGIDSIVGAFIAGLALNRAVNHYKEAFQNVEFITINLFIPCFLVSVGLLANPKILIQHPENLGLAALVILGAVGAKFGAAWLSGLSFRYTFPETMVITGLTISRAALVMVISLYGKETPLPGTNPPLPILHEGLFNAIVVYILVTCFVGPFVTERFAKHLATDALQPSPQVS